MSTTIPPLPAPTVHVTLFTTGARKARRKWDAAGRDPSGILTYSPPCDAAEICCTLAEVEEFERDVGDTLASADVLPSLQFETLATWLQENAGLKLDIVIGYPEREGAPVIPDAVRNATSLLNATYGPHCGLNGDWSVCAWCVWNSGQGVNRGTGLYITDNEDDTFSLVRRDSEADSSDDNPAQLEARPAAQVAELIALARTYPRSQ